MCSSLPRIIIVYPSCTRVFFKCPSLNITTNLSQPTQSSSTNCNSGLPGWPLLSFLPLTYLTRLCWFYQSLLCTLSSTFTKSTFSLMLDLARFCSSHLTFTFLQIFTHTPGFSSSPCLHPQFSANLKTFGKFVP